MVIYFYDLKVGRDISGCGNFGNISRKCIFIMDKGEKTASTGGVRHSLSNASCECMCVVENKFEIGKEVLDVVGRFVGGEFGLLDMYEGRGGERVVYQTL